MIFGNFSYVAYMAIFGWIPIILLWVCYHKILLKYTKIIRKLLVFYVFVIALPWDHIALSFNVWNYSPDKILGVHIWLSPIETVFLAITLVLALSSFTIIFYEKRSTWFKRLS